MGSQTGLSRRLPPMPDKNQKVEDQKVNRRNIIVVKINSADRIYAGSEPIDVSQLKDKIKEFLTNPTDDPTLPEKEEKEIEGYGKYRVSKGVISLPRTNPRYELPRPYIAFRTNLQRPINEIRDESRSALHQSRLHSCKTNRKFVKKCIPQLISEAEPRMSVARITGGYIMSKFGGNTKEGSPCNVSGPCRYCVHAPVLLMVQPSCVNPKQVSGQGA